jgi:hypothetical protein
MSCGKSRLKSGTNLVATTYVTYWVAKTAVNISALAQARRGNSGEKTSNKAGSWLHAQVCFTDEMSIIGRTTLLVRCMGIGILWKRKERVNIGAIQEL